MAVNEAQMRALKDRARRMRIDILKTLHGCGSGHTGGSLSATDIMAALYFYKMKYDPKKPDWKGRDYFILSKGHAAPVLYATLAHAGFIDRVIRTVSICRVWRFPRAPWARDCRLPAASRSPKSWTRR